jgi:hypothetical protein
MTIPPQTVTPAPPLAAAVGQWSPLTVSVLALLTFVVALGIGELDPDHVTAGAAC